MQHGVLSDYAQPAITANRLTVQGLLKQNSYRIAHIGKWALGYAIIPGKPQLEWDIRPAHDLRHPNQ